MKGLRDTMRFAIISDIHITPPFTQYYYRGVIRKFGNHARQLVRDFVQTMNCSIFPELVIQLGDVVESFNEFTNRDNFIEIKNLLDELDCPVQHVIGDHDSTKLETHELMQILNYCSPYYSFDVQDYHFVVLHAVKQAGVYRIPEEQTRWLRYDLSSTNSKTFIFSHQALADQDLRGNFWFEDDPESCLIENRHSIRAIIRDIGNVVGVFNGHLHWNRVDIHDGIPYISIQSLVENVHFDGKPANAYAIVDACEDNFQISVNGNDTMELFFPFAGEEKAPKKVYDLSFIS